MDYKTYTVAAHIDAAVFRNFAVFDNLRLRRVWRSPLLFALILGVSACICFALKARAPQAPMLGGLLLAIGIGLPTFYFLNFFVSVRTQIKKLRLDQRPKAAYTLTICEPDDICITAGTQQISLAWGDVFGAYRAEDCIYLYAAANRAYLLPEAQMNDDADALWTLLCKRVTTGRTRDLRRSK